MTPKERNDLRELMTTKHEGNVEAAVCDFLGLSAEYKSANGVPQGNVGAVFNIADELEKYAELDAAETAADRDPASGRTADENTGGESQA